jgi:hypothetical protein
MNSTHGSILLGGGMKNKKLENSIKSLINLYTVVIGAALSLAIAGIIDGKIGLTSVGWVSVLLFISFVATLFPFFHGALRHLDDAFVENENVNIRSGALIIDFLLLFLHGLAFLVLSQLLKRPSNFAWFLFAVLAIDVIWGIFAHFASSSGKELSAESKWTIINFIFICIGASYLVSQDIYLDYEKDSLKLAILVTIGCVARSAVDYLWCRELYFPKTA